MVKKTNTNEKEKNLVLDKIDEIDDDDESLEIRITEKKPRKKPQYDEATLQKKRELMKRCNEIRYQKAKEKRDRLEAEKQKLKEDAEKRMILKTEKIKRDFKKANKNLGLDMIDIDENEVKQIIKKPKKKVIVVESESESEEEVIVRKSKRIQQKQPEAPVQQIKKSPNVIWI